MSKYFTCMLKVYNSISNFDRKFGFLHGVKHVPNISHVKGLCDIFIMSYIMSYLTYYIKDLFNGVLVFIGLLYLIN